jgi:hypothetical protein
MPVVERSSVSRKQLVCRNVYVPPVVSSLLTKRFYFEFITGEDESTEVGQTMLSTEVGSKPRDTSLTSFTVAKLISTKPIGAVRVSTVAVRVSIGAHPSTSRRSMMTNIINPSYSAT